MTNYHGFWSRKYYLCNLWTQILWLEKKTFFSAKTGPEWIWTHCKETPQAQDLCDTPAGGRAGDSLCKPGCRDRTQTCWWHRVRGCRRSSGEPGNGLIFGRILKAEQPGTFSSAKQSYFCLRDSLRTETLTNLVSLKKKKALSHASTSLAYSQVNAPYRQKEMKNYWSSVNTPLPTTKHCYFLAKYVEIKGTAQRTVCLTGFLKAINYTII